MQLLYLYIQEHHSLGGQNINFGGPLRFSYDPYQRSLNVSENPQHLEGFFQTSAVLPADAIINNVSAVIGQNGTGKTSVLNFIKEELSGGIIGLRSPILLAARRSDGQIILYRCSDIPLQGGNSADFGVELSTLALEEQGEYTSRAYKDEENLPFLTDTSFISFSNVFDGRTSKVGSGLRDISTDYLVSAERYYETTMRIQKIDEGSELETFRFNETERQIDFINFFRLKDIIPFKLPEKLTVSSKRQFTHHNYLDHSKEKSALQRNQLKPIADRIVACLKAMKISEEGYRGWMVSFFHVQSLLNFLQEMSFDIKVPFGDMKFTADQPDFSSYSLKEINTYLTDTLKKLSESDKSLLPLKDMSVAIADLNRYIDVHATGDEVQMQKEGRSFELKIDNEQFAKFYSCYKKTYKHRPYLSFDWRSISSGEKAFLNIYSRFFSLSDSQTRFNDGRLLKNVVILIDEGDLYLHPEWQRRFVFLLCEFLTKCYASQDGTERSIQVIFTSNSPIPVSDLPNGNVIFLQTQNGKTLAKDSLEDKKQTFGANIHTLLSDGFFLSHGLMGEFAKHKINSIIEMLQGNREEVIKKRLTIEKNISLIGEPLIRTKLVQMFTEKLQMNMMDVNDRLSILESEIKILKAQQNKD